MKTKKKKNYRKPFLAKVDLTIEDAVLSCCKTNAEVNPTAAKRTCTDAKCVSAQTNLS